MRRKICKALPPPLPLPQNGPRQAQQLPLADTEIGAALLHVVFQAVLHALDGLQNWVLQISFRIIS